MSALDEWITESRTHKALALADECRRQGLSAVGVLHSTEQKRRELEHAAGTHKGSDDTWRQVIGLLLGAAMYPCPWCLIGDPEGPVGPPQEYGHPGLCVR